MLSIPKLIPARCSVDKSYAEFQENATKVLVADTASQRKRQGDRSTDRSKETEECGLHIRCPIVISKYRQVNIRFEEMLTLILLRHADFTAS